VRNEIINMVVDHLVLVFGGVGCPSKDQLIFFHNQYFNTISELAVMREIVAIMGINYPNLFQEISCEGKI
jgi:hypothetical protein